ncbi:unnamed protein product [Sphagnum jensenii]|uniref:Secreted protein n=1 Tax=Sphagnum jensenii TaxID=128206 RepID=A0ABP1AFW1_9BRYO
MAMRHCCDAAGATTLLVQRCWCRSAAVVTMLVLRRCCCSDGTAARQAATAMALKYCYCSALLVPRRCD